MYVFGADFSGAKDPSRGIYYAVGELDGIILKIKNVRHCEDRLDLFGAIVASNAPWGIDFPFAVPEQVYTQLDLSGWDKLLSWAVDTPRTDFMASLKERLEETEAICGEGKPGCRVTDIESKSFSPLKLNNPNMRAMTYGGLKLLFYLRQAEVAIYPFDEFVTGPRVYEVYPSGLWSLLGLSRGTDVEPASRKLNELDLLNLRLPPDLTLKSKDAADAVLACATMASAISRYNIERSWDTRPPNISIREWEKRHTEGVIVRCNV